MNTGLKQGCVISPLLFSLFLNDLATEIKNSGKGLNIGDELVALLLFADDLVVLCESEEDLQSVLDIIHKWHNQWKMLVNIDKMKVVHFGSSSMSATQHVFTYGSNTIEDVDQYKYLDFILTDTLDYKVTAFMEAPKAASRALCLPIAKSKAYGGLPYEVYSHLYNSLVHPIIDYVAVIWGTNQYSCISAVQHLVCQYFMGVGLYTPNAAVQGDMGWDMPAHRQWIAVSRH